MEEAKLDDIHHFELLKHSVESEWQFDAEDLRDIGTDRHRQGRSACDREEPQSSYHRSRAHQTRLNSRADKLEAPVKAKTVISEDTSGAESFGYGLTHISLLQLFRSVLSLRGGFPNFETEEEQRSEGK